MKKLLMVFIIAITFIACKDDNPINHAESFMFEVSGVKIKKVVTRKEIYYFEKHSFEDKFTRISQNEFNRWYDIHYRK
jgi:uncharacterized protein YcfL